MTQGQASCWNMALQRRGRKQRSFGRRNASNNLPIKMLWKRKKQKMMNQAIDKAAPFSDTMQP